jgi:hypothetical protein
LKSSEWFRAAIDEPYLRVEHWFREAAGRGNHGRIAEIGSDDLGLPRGRRRVERETATSDNLRARVGRRGDLVTGGRAKTGERLSDVDASRNGGERLTNDNKVVQIQRVN